MARDARTKSETGIYHIVMRGSGRQLIFEDSTDRRAFLDKLRQLRDEQGLTIYAFCLMSNHVHLLAKEGNEPIGSTMKRLGVSYAMRFNLKTGHVGHVFQDRYASEPVNDDSYLLAVVRYIHANPEVAGICKQAEYRWSSYSEYTGTPDLCEVSFVLDLIGNKDLFEEFSSASEISPCLDIQQARRRLGDAEAADVAQGLFGPNIQAAFEKVERSERDRMLRLLRDAGISVRQAERITGIGRKSVSTAYSKTG